MEENEYSHYTIQQLEEMQQKINEEKKLLLEQKKQLEIARQQLDNQGNQSNSMTGKTKTLSGAHNVFSSENVMQPTGFNGTISNQGFTTKIIIALITSFGLGMIAMGIYIFINLNKFSFTL